jgi:hypothetical protein
MARKPQGKPLDKSPSIPGLGRTTGYRQFAGGSFTWIDLSFAWSALDLLSQVRQSRRSARALGC